MCHTSLLSFLSNGDDGDCIGKGAEIFGLLSYTMVDCDIFGPGVVPGRWEGPAASSRDTRWRRKRKIARRKRTIANGRCNLTCVDKRFGRTRICALSEKMRQTLVRCGAHFLFG